VGSIKYLQVSVYAQIVFATLYSPMEVGLEYAVIIMSFST
jgi:hypothetical protein